MFFQIGSAEEGDRPTGRLEHLIKKYDSKGSIELDLKKCDEMQEDKMRKAMSEFDEFPFSKWKTSRDRDYRKELFNKLTTDYTNFSKCLQLVDKSFSDYKQEIIKFTTGVKLFNNNNLMADIDAKQMELLDTYPNYFSLTAPNKGKVMKFDFGLILQKKINNTWITPEPGKIDPNIPGLYEAASNPSLNKLT